MKFNISFSEKLLVLILVLIATSIASTPQITIVVKFKSQTIKLPQDQKKGMLNDFSEEGNELKKYFEGISNEIIFEKLIPKAQSSDTIYVNKRGEIKELNDWSQVFKITIKNSAKDIGDIMEELRKMDKVIYAEPPVQVVFNYTPGDLHGELHQWGLSKVNAEDAWDITKGSSSVKIAVIERGVASHTDINSKLTGGDIGSSDHGLMVAGISGCETDNSIGLASLGYNVMIIPKNISTSSFPQAILEAADPAEDDADIINCSFKTVYYPNQTEYYSYNYSAVEDAIEDAIAWGKIVVAAAGNPPSGIDQDEVPYTIWPAAYTGVIGVSAIDSTDNFISGYNFGSHVDICAPGIDISVLDLNNQYSVGSGTSFSAPFVSALAALILSNDNTLTPTEVQEILELTANDLGSNGYDYYYGHGRINALEAVKNLYIPEIYSTIQSALNVLQANQEIIIGSSHDLVQSYELSTGQSITITSEASLALNNYTFQVGNGSIVIEEGAEINPDVRIYSGEALKGLYPTLSSALTAASSGETIYVESDIEVNSSELIPSGVTLVLESGTITLATGVSIVSSSGSIDIDGATVSPNIQVNASGTIYGLYKTVQAALTACSGGSGDVRVYGGTFQENVSVPSGKGLFGFNNALIDGNVTLSSCSGSDLVGVQVDGVVQISYGSYVYLEDLIISNGRIDIDCGSGHTIDNVELGQSAYIDVYQSSPELYDIESTATNAYSVYMNQASPDICSGTFSGKTNAIYCGSYADATVDGNYCNNTYDIFAGSNSDVTATGVNTFSDSDSADCIHTSGSGFVDLPATLNACAGGARQEIKPMLAKASGWSEIEGLFNDFRALKKQIRNDRKQNRKNFDPSNYQSNYQNLANEAKKLIADENSRTAAKALRLFSYCCWALGEESQLLTLDKDVNMNDAHVNAVVLGLKVPVYAKNKQFDAALNTIDAMLAAERDTESYVAILYRKGVLYENHIQDTGKAAEIYTRIVTEFADSPTAWAAQKRLDDLKGGDKEIQPETIVPEEMEFAIKNYPNPANPGTTIQFSLPEDGHVSLTIYNVMGQKVSELTNANMPKGVYNIRWNGVDAYGSAAASGMYFYRIVYENQILTNKFLLMR